MLTGRAKLIGATLGSEPGMPNETSVTMKLSEPRGESGLIPQTIIAFRMPEGDDGWSLRGFECVPRDLDLGAVDREDYCEVGFTYCRAAWARRALTRVASRSGWQQGVTGAWFPIDEPMPVSSGQPRRSKVSVRLKTIDYGCIAFEVRAWARPVQLFFDDVEDSLAVFVRFLQILQAGGEPHAALADRATSHFFVHSGREPGVCRFRLEAVDLPERPQIDVLTDRRELVETFRGLAIAIADHPWFAHLFACHRELPDTEYERVATNAREAWEAQYGETLEDEAEDFIREAICAKVPLSAKSLRYVEQQRAMLRTLVIPEMWGVGLRGAS